MSASSRETSLRFSSMRAGVTDLARTEELRATVFDMSTTIRLCVLTGKKRETCCLTMIAQQHGSRPNTVFPRHLVHRLVFEQRRSRAPKRTVGRNMDALFPAKIHHLLLGQQRMVLYLVHGRGDGGLRKQLLEVLDRVVCDADGLDLVGTSLYELL
jgi:hypothetical protein